MRREQDPLGMAPASSIGYLVFWVRPVFTLHPQPVSLEHGFKWLQRFQLFKYSYFFLKQFIIKFQKNSFLYRKERTRKMNPEPALVKASAHRGQPASVKAEAHSRQLVLVKASAHRGQPCLLACVSPAATSPVAQHSFISSVNLSVCP